MTPMIVQMRYNAAAAAALYYLLASSLVFSFPIPYRRPTAVYSFDVSRLRLSLVQPGGTTQWSSERKEVKSILNRTQGLQTKADGDDDSSTTSAPNGATIQKTEEEETGDISNGTLLEGIIAAITENDSSRRDRERFRTRMIDTRSYARLQPFQKINLLDRPSIEDLLPLRVSWRESFYVTVPAKLLTFTGYTFLFPYVIRYVLEPAVADMPASDLNDIANDFAPGISILYSAMIALTLQFLYSRQKNIQDSIARETSLLSIVTKNLLSLFAKDRDLLVDAGKCVADQVATLVRKSRGEELMELIYSDPYSRIIDLIDAEEERIEERQGNFLRKGPLLGNCRDLINQLVDIRANRLSQEANALSETHFSILNSLTFLVLLGYSISVLPTIENLGGYPNLESSMLFGLISTVYVLFSNFAYDLNEPFTGVYQLRRSASASHLLQIKWNLVNHPWLRNEIDFDDDDDEADDASINYQSEKSSKNQN